MRAGRSRTASRRPVRAENSAISAVRLPAEPTQAAVTTFDPSGVISGSPAQEGSLVAPLAPPAQDRVVPVVKDTTYGRIARTS
jgi:hypothetical protein